MYRTRSFSPILIVLIFSIVAAIASGIAVYYYSVGKSEVEKKKISEELENLKKDYEKLKVEHEQLKASSSQAEKSNTYTNEKDGYSINYPAGWFVTKDSEGVILTNFKYPQEDGTELSGNQTKIVINLKNNPQKMTPKTWALNTIGEETTVLKKEELKIASKDAYKVKTEGLGVTTSVFVAKTSTKMLEIINYGDDSELSNILESLKFI